MNIFAQCSDKQGMKCLALILIQRSVQTCAVFFHRLFSHVLEFLDNQLNGVSNCSARIDRDDETMYDIFVANLNLVFV